MVTDQQQERSIVKQIGLWLGPAFFLLMFLTAGSQETMPRDAWLVAGVGLWMATWWSTEAIYSLFLKFIGLLPKM